MKTFKRSVIRSKCSDFSNLNKFCLKMMIIFCIFTSVQNTFETGKTLKSLYNGILKGKFANFDTIRSYVDKKKYFMYTLPSKLEVLIIQDLNVKIAAAAMTVNSGVNKEGTDIYGLAHFCEHMLFLGSKKYDQPTYFVDYVTQHGGKFNGYTDFENTAFYFFINSEKFRKALDIFSRFFIDPLFSKEYVEKEVNSVNSEYERNIQLDSKRKEMILREIADKDSLFHRFSTGNIKTLLEYSRKNNIDLRKRVLEYYKINYRPDNMKLVIYGDKPVEFYKSLVDNYFAEMKERKDSYNPQQLSNWTKLPWEFNKIGKIVLMKTINKHQELDISFLIDDLFQTLPDNPAFYFKILLNYRGKGSLNDILRKKGLVAGIKCMLRRTHKGFSLFKLKGYITKNGIKNIDQVISVIFNYLKYVRKRALNKELYSYIKRAFDVAFFFNKKKKRIVHFIRGICHIVWKYPRKYYFSQHKILDSYKVDSIKNFGDKLVLKNSIILVGNNSFDEDLLKNYPNFINGFDQFKNLNTETVLNKKDPFYLTNYNEFQINKKFIDIIDTPEIDSELKNQKLHLFAHKKKLPNKISLVKMCPEWKTKECAKEFKKDAKDLTPTIIKKNEFYELWYKEDRSFYITKSNLFIKFIFDLNVNDIDYATMLRVLVNAFHHHLRNFFFEESLRQNTFQLKASANGFSVRIFSFSEILPQTAISFFKQLNSLKLSPEEFDLIKDELKNEIKSKLNLVPAMRAYVNFFKLILKDYVHFSVILKRLETLTLEEFEKFFQAIFKKLFLKCFVHGTISKINTITMFENLFNSLTMRKENHLYKKIQLVPIKDKKLKNYLNLHADLSGYFIFREKLKKSYNINHAVLNFYQIGRESIQNMVGANLVKALCGYIYFTQLRIKEQLGYTARAKIFSEGNILYYMIVVQGSKKSPDYMDIRIENVIRLMRKRIEEASDAKFNKFKHIIKLRIGRRDKTLKGRTQRLWNEIISGRNYFNIRQSVKDYVSTIKKSDILNFFDNMVKTKLKKLSVQEFSSIAKNIPNTQPMIRGYNSHIVKNIEYFRNRNKFLYGK